MNFKINLSIVRPAGVNDSTFTQEGELTPENVKATAEAIKAIDEDIETQDVKTVYNLDVSIVDGTSAATASLSNVSKEQIQAFVDTMNATFGNSGGQGTDTGNGSQNDNNGGGNDNQDGAGTGNGGPVAPVVVKGDPDTDGKVTTTTTYADGTVTTTVTDANGNEVSKATVDKDGNEAPNP